MDIMPYIAPEVAQEVKKMESVGGRHLTKKDFQDLYQSVFENKMKMYYYRKIICDITIFVRFYVK